MTIYIPTCELVGILNDTIPFASPDEEYPVINAVNVFWDGEMLNAQATDRIALSWSRWHPDDDPTEDEQEDLFQKWGGGDDPWKILLPLTDAQDIVKNFKLSTKLGWTPLTVDCLDDRLKVARSRDTGRSALTQEFQGREGEYPNLAGLLAAHSLPQPIDGLAYDAKHLALFAQVRQRGSMQLTFTGANHPTHISIGERFTGAIQPVRVKAEDSTDND